VGAACHYFGSWNTAVTPTFLENIWPSVSTVLDPSAKQLNDSNSNHLNTKINLSYMYTLRSYRAVNTPSRSVH